MLQIARQLELEGLRITWSYVARCMSKSKRTAQELRLRLASLKRTHGKTLPNFPPCFFGGSIQGRPFREYGGRGDVDTIGRGGRGGVRGSSGISLTASEAVQGGGASWHRGRDCRRGVRGTGNAALAVVNVNHACDSSGRGGRGCRGSRSIGSVAHTTSNDKQLAVGLESVVVATVEVETPRLSLLLLAMFAELAAALSPAIVGASVAQAVLRLAEKTEIWATIEAGLVGVVVALSGSSALMDGALLVVLCVAVRLLLPHADRSGTNDGQDV
ncbi:hypothetical protein JG687_00016458 [Phytophthora cactorum]|uniref:Uncharacterized protein n=1 Tax=Phytophthora cactorum TaxID=29920 RepID=A0A8T1TUF3_9STRA|nr:hypothetical protein JG687_00016458 [Phytophthora cactorum]